MLVQSESIMDIGNSETGRLSSPVSIRPKPSDLATFADASLLASAYHGLRTLRCEFHEGILMVRGRVSSFYLKQLAQEAIRKLPGVEMIANLVEVVEANRLEGLPTSRT